MMMMMMMMMMIIIIIIVIKFHSWKGPWETIWTLLSVCEAYLRKQCYSEKIRLEFQGMNDLQVTERVALPSQEYQILFYSQECRLKRELDTKSFSTRLEASLAQLRHFTCPRFRSENEEFTIHHFADSVSYQVEGLVKKNKVPNVLVP